MSFSALIMTPDTARLDIEVKTAEEIPVLYKSRLYWEQYFKERGLWPEMLAYDPTYQKYSAEVDRKFAAFQLAAVISSTPRRVIGVAHSVPLHIADPHAELPNTGWDFALENSIANAVAGVRPNSVCGLSITVLPEFQQRGIGRKLIEAIVCLASQRGIPRVIMPVRPVSKERWPNVSMEEFLTLKRDDGFHADPWIRAHQRVGGNILSICDSSMTVLAALSKWELWSGRTFSESGEYIVKGCLAPVVIDTVQGTGQYTEPNVWMGHTSL